MMNRLNYDIRHRLEHFIEIDGIMYRNACDCGNLISGLYANLCRPCAVETFKERKWSETQRKKLTGLKRSEETRKKLREAHSKSEGHTYSGIHTWLRREHGPAYKCQNEDCLRLSSTYDWANVSGKYKKDLSDWMQLCRKCHFQLDKCGVEVRV